MRNPGKLRTRLSIVIIIVFGSLLIYHRHSLLDIFMYPPPTHTKYQATCPPNQWINGQWKPKLNYSFPALKNPDEPDEVIAMAGFKRCASTREVNWHLGGPKERPDRFPKLNSFEWESGCMIRPFSAEEVITDLIQLGGWLIIGDSVSEGHFFSLSCLLGEHTRAEPDEPSDYIPQQLYLKEDSPLISRIRLPKGYDINRTPLATFIRCDFLMRIKSLSNLYKTLHHPPSDFKLFEDQNLKTSGPEDYMPVFTNPLYHYSTLIVSTAAWWNMNSLTGMKNPDRPDEHGTPELIQFYSDAMTLWASQVQKALFNDQRRYPYQNRKQVIVRAFPGGHDDCFNHFEPTKVDMGHPVKHYNWPLISTMNDEFEKVVKDFLDIHYLGIDYPARLRPDSHAPWDCLHYAGGTGVNEGWSHYIWYYTMNLASRGLLTGVGWE